jgi:peptide/nickel transport system permease protein
MEKQPALHKIKQSNLQVTLKKTWSNFISFFKEDGFAMAGLIIYSLFILIAIFAPLLAPYDPHEMVRIDGEVQINKSPNSNNWLGTTNMGRDVFSQLVYGARPAVLVGVSAAFMVVAIGTLIGLIAGYFRGRVDSFLMRTTDVAFGIPFEPFVIVLVAFLGPSVWNIVLAMGLLLWRDTARVIRSQVLVVRERGFVESARVAGASHFRILFQHIAPNILPLALLYGSLAMGWAILTEAAISFLGFGDPSVVSWGYMLHDAFVSQALSRGSYFWFVPPGICIMLIVMAGFYIGRGSEKILYPRLNQY